MKAPEWSVAQWMNTKEALRLEDLRGRVVVLHTFQMLCPGCVEHGLPQAKRVFEMFSPDEVAVIGLHTVFEHHEAMQPVSLKAFLHEYRITFPVGVDAHEPGDTTPITMKRYGLRGTPSLVLIDREGDLRASIFGRPSDLWLGASIAQCVGTSSAPVGNDEASDGKAGCDDEGCRVPDLASAG